MRDGSRGEALRSGGAKEVPPVADVVQQANPTRAQDVVLAAGDNTWEEATLRLAPELSGAVASSSRQPDADDFPRGWCTGLDRPEIPAETVDCTMAEYGD
jgi:hypothetical protein